MRRRLYFLLPDLASAQRVEQDLLLAQIEARHMHFLGRDDLDLDGLPKAGLLERSDLVHGAESGLVVGLVAGAVAGGIVLAFPPPGTVVNFVIVLLTAIFGAAFGAWVSGMIASSIPNSRLKAFEKDIGQGRILLMVDVPPARVEEVRALVARHHPEARGGGQEPTIPAFP